MNQKAKQTFTSTLAAVALSALTGCGSSSDDVTPIAVVPDPVTPDPVAQTNAYNGPGSKWDAELHDDGTYIITRRPDAVSDIDMTVEGTYDRTPLGFVLITVEAASGANAPEVGDQAWAVEAPGYALMLHTDGDQFIPMIEAGTCPDQNTLSNWVIARTRLEADPTETDGDYFGTFQFMADTGVASLPSKYALSDNFPETSSVAQLNPTTCADGVAMVDDAEMFLTTDGGAIVHTNLSDPDESSIIFALAQKTIASVAGLDADYAGILFDASGADDQRIAPVVLECSNAQCSGQFVSDVAAGATSGTFTIDLSDR